MDPTQLAVSTYQKIAQVYTDTYFDDLSDAPYVDRFLALLPAKSNILDVGCGPGQFTQYMINQGFLVTGIDLSTQMLALARAKVPNGTFLEMDMRQLEFPDNYFDGLLAAYSLIHIASKEIEATLQQFFRVLKNGGVLEILSQKGPADQLVDEPFLPSEQMFFNFFSKERIVQFLESAGFVVYEQFEKGISDAASYSDTVIYTIARKTR